MSPNSKSGVRRCYRCKLRYGSTCCNCKYNVYSTCEGRKCKCYNAVVDYNRNCNPCAVCSLVQSLYCLACSQSCCAQDLSQSLVYRDRTVLAYRLAVRCLKSYYRSAKNADTPLSICQRNILPVKFTMEALAEVKAAVKD